MWLSSSKMHPRKVSPRDVRIICDCQRHALHERKLHRRAVRGIRIIGRHLQRRGVALLVGVPLAFGAIGIPIEAMDVSIPLLSSINDSARDAQPPSSLPIFTTRKIRDTFLHPENAPEELTLEIAKERFFNSEVPYGSIIYREAVRN